MTQQTSTPEQIRKTLDWTVDPYSSPCGCMGPQDDEPLCPCAMRNVIRWRGRWVQMSVVGNDAPADDFLSDLTPAVRKGYCEYEVILAGIGQDKLAVVREVRQITGLGLFDTKKLVDNALSTKVAIKKNLSRDEAERIKAQLEAVGANAEVQ